MLLDEPYAMTRIHLSRKKNKDTVEEKKKKHWRKKKTFFFSRPWVIWGDGWLVMERVIHNQQPATLEAIKL